MIGTEEQIRERFKLGEIYMYGVWYAVPVSYERNKYGEWMIRCKVESASGARLLTINADDLRERKKHDLFG